MKTRIEELEKAFENHEYPPKKYNSTFAQAYFYSIEAGNEMPNFAEVIWDNDIDEILKNCKKCGITEFTISSTFSSLIETIDELLEKGCILDGMVKIKSRSIDFRTGEKAIIPAFKLSL